MDDKISARPGEDDAEARYGEISEMDADGTYRRLKEWFRVDFAHSSEWRRNARNEFDFVAGDQWSPVDKAALNDQGRPAITFNRTLAIVRAVAGIEINGRHDTVFLPRGMSPGAVKANEVLSGASRWMADGCDAEDEQSEAFQDSVICGMGWTEQRLDYDEEPDGAYVEEKVDPIEMVWDHAARRKNLSDARRLFRVRKMSLAEARVLAESMTDDVIDDVDLNASWAFGVFEAGDPKPVEERRHRFENAGEPDASDEVHIVHAQWVEFEDYYRVVNPATGKIESVDCEEFASIKKKFADLGVKLDAVKQRRKVYKQAMLGGCIIGEVRETLVRGSFTYQCITGERHRNKGTWFGLVSLMMDPQMWANKWLSQTLHILNTTAKGGIIAESDAFEDQREAQATYAKPDSITWAAKDAIAKGKIMQKPGAGIPTAYVNLLEFAISSIRDVTGINLELLGMRDANQPGILEAQRKQAAMTILATMFDSLRRFRKNVGRVRLGVIQNYLADGRLIRVVGPEGMIAVPLIRDKTLGQYEVIVDDAPTSPNQKQETWGFLMQLMPMFKGMMSPEAAVAMMEYSPLPSKLVDALKAMLTKPNPDADKERAMAEAAAGAKVQKDIASADKAKADAELARIKGVIDLANAHMSAPPATVAPPMPSEQRMRPPANEDYVVPPVGGRQLPMPPELPQVPIEGGAPEAGTNGQGMPGILT